MDPKAKFVNPRKNLKTRDLRPDPNKIKKPKTQPEGLKIDPTHPYSVVQLHIPNTVVILHSATTNVMMY